ncbi:hypothetical protein CEE37_06020 [candidate division LCP-89 bacterium B3_LCP]|uniref:Right handed beta helix domain-containing protein n=1 Tax=candidate division LCP-89 bacterium B3_LCP TaxID=2012998 RepID=A0A532V255_UNCL8|nr:MAG: hypothetical protein CEE37_06020 [candidate division LCP-89 bacterium B3_LCP]
MEDEMFRNILFVLLSELTLISFVFAQTIIPGGEVSGTWTAAGSPYLVEGEITVPADQTLVIDPGVDVIFQGHYKLIVNGWLEAVGTEADSVLFTADNSTEGWHGIRFIGAPDSSHLSYCIVQYGRATGSSPDCYGGGIYCANSNPSFVNCTISGNASFWDGGGGGIYCYDSSPIIGGCIISGNSANYGNGGGIYCDGSNLIISDNTINGNSSGPYGGGIYCDNSALTIANNAICMNSATYGGGIYCTGSSISIIDNSLNENSAVYYGGGIHCSSSSIAINGNTISGNTAIHSFEPYPAYGGGIYCSGLDSNSSIIGNTISTNTVSGYMGGFGGGIYCNSSSITINGNTISENSADGGGGIHCYNSNLTISYNTIKGNSASSGGGINCTSSNPIISGNTISRNGATSFGGGINCTSSSPSISYNLIYANTAGSGGGINCNNGSSPGISGNAISENFAADGGGVYCSSSPSIIEFNEISDNTASGSGGGIYFNLINVPMNKNTITFNNASIGGGFYSTSSNPELRNCILWANAPQQIFQTAGSNVQATYSNIEQFWPGIGNINQDPSFVNVGQSDYRLQWDSPCINSGDPDPQFSDPDGTRADMGCYYFDQSKPVRILLTPYNTPIQIQAEGGSFDFDIQATNIDSVLHTTQIWCDVTMPNLTIYGPVLGPVSVTLMPQFTASRLRNQNVPPAAPAGRYFYNAYAVVGADTSIDHFLFEKLDSNGLDGFAEWFNTGGYFEDFAVAGRQSASMRIPESYLLHQNYPNPFNSTTTLCFDLPEADWVKLDVFDISGCMVADLKSASIVDRWCEAGTHEVTFEGSGLASGVYIYRLKIGKFVANGKMVLLK